MLETTSLTGSYAGPLLNKITLVQSFFSHHKSTAGSAGLSAPDGRLQIATQ
jgi:hypothetical protein